MKYSISDGVLTSDKSAKMYLQGGTSRCPTMSTFFVLLLLTRVRPSNASFGDCYSICSQGMSDECCSCIGCDQSMRFGKRSEEDSVKQARWMLRDRVYGKRSAFDATPHAVEVDEDATYFGAKNLAKLYLMERLLKLERLQREQ